MKHFVPVTCSSLLSYMIHLLTLLQYVLLLIEVSLALA
ncbi:hypothetical protein BVRB_4g081220 [Beta vulgaris subsp. vulgaris]|nr:hypothetical protein BVRB_4g081220 [Beta vulgaris subsp. vulgaris]